MIKSVKKSIVTSLSMMMLLTSFQVGAKAESDKVKKMFGSGRVETSIMTSKEVKSKTLVIASGYSFADSLSAFNIASFKKAKLVLIGKDASPLDSVLKDGGIEEVYAVGGKNTLTDAVEKKVESYGKKVNRISGKDRYETNKLTLDKAGYNSVGVADGRNFPDALSASGLLKAKGLGLMLVNGSKPYKTDKKVVYTFGGEDSVRQSGGKRISGKDRYDTSKMINSEIGNVNTVAVASGSIFADALSAVNILNIGDGSAIILVGKSVDDVVSKLIDSAKNVYIIGGSVSSNVVDKISGNKAEEKKDNKGTNIYVGKKSKTRQEIIEDIKKNSHIFNKENNNMVHIYDLGKGIGFVHTKKGKKLSPIEFRYYYKGNLSPDELRSIKLDSKITLNGKPTDKVRLATNTPIVGNKDNTDFDYPEVSRKIVYPVEIELLSDDIEGDLKVSLSVKGLEENGFKWDTYGSAYLLMNKIPEKTVELYIDGKKHDNTKGSKIVKNQEHEIALKTVIKINGKIVEQPDRRLLTGVKWSLRKAKNGVIDEEFYKSNEEVKELDGRLYDIPEVIFDEYGYQKEHINKKDNYYGEYILSSQTSLMDDEPHYDKDGNYMMLDTIFTNITYVDSEETQ